MQRTAAAKQAHNRAQIQPSSMRNRSQGTATGHIAYLLRAASSQLPFVLASVMAQSLLLLRALLALPAAVTLLLTLTEAAGAAASEACAESLPLEVAVGGPTDGCCSTRC